VSRNSEYRETRKEAIGLWQNTLSWTEAVSKAEETPKRKANKFKVNARIRGVKSGCLKSNAVRPIWKTSRGNPQSFCAMNLFLTYTELGHSAIYTLWVLSSFLRVCLPESLINLAYLAPQFRNENIQMPDDDSLHRTRLLECMCVCATAKQYYITFTVNSSEECLTAARIRRK
jgi:hypothetical protein